MTSWERSYARSAPWFLLPAVVLLGVFVVVPTLHALYLSFHQIDLLSLDRQRWSGVSQYGAVLSDPRFRRAFANTAVFALLVVPSQTVVSFALALWVNRPEAPWRALRTVFFAPTVVAMPVLAILWTLLYQPVSGSDAGPINRVLLGLGLPAHAWLRDPRTSLLAVAAMSVWQGVGLQMMIFLAGLKTVPPAQLEAAKLDGASAWQRTWHITIPALRNTFVFVLSVTSIFAFRLFVQPYLMTRGGPGNSSVSLVEAIYEMTFVAQDLGMACAASMLLLVTLCVLTALQRLALAEVRE
jgi:ABC-type sugar transport system permease subunit